MSLKQSDEPAAGSTPVGPCVFDMLLGIIDYGRTQCDFGSSDCVTFAYDSVGYDY